MSRVLFILFFSIVSLYSFEFKTYDEAMKEQTQNNKIIMLEVVRTGCHYCEDMQEKVFEDKEMSQWINERFIPVKINLDKEELPLDIQVNFTPTFYFINSQKEIVKKIPGAWNITDFKDLTRKIK